VATRRGLTLREIDERLTIEDVLDEHDLSLYVYDLDQEPADKPTEPPNGGAGPPARSANFEG
jgi:hypothetical protein